MLKSLGLHLVADAGELEIHIDESEIVLASLLMNTQMQPKTKTLSTKSKVKDNCKSHFPDLRLKQSMTFHFLLMFCNGAGAQVSSTQKCTHQLKQGSGAR